MIESMSEHNGWLHNIFQEQSPQRRMDSNAVNDKIATRAILKVLFARLTVFLAFLEEGKRHSGGSLTNDMKFDWLLFQILPPVTSQNIDPFLARIDNCLTGANIDRLHYLNSPPSKLKKALGPDFDLGKFFYVLDEAQATGRHYMGCFSDAEGQYRRPVLQPIIRALESYPGIPIIISGTGFSLDHFKTMSISGVAKYFPWQEEYGTGDFTIQDVQLAYVTSLLPPAFLASKSGMAFLRRSYEWLRGRYVTLTMYC
jgi:hypothetical protein